LTANGFLRQETPAMRARNTPLSKMMLGFVVRRCAVAVGHEPTAEEFAAWANNYPNGGRSVRLFGRPISVAEARLILRHPGRPVSARTAAPHERAAPAGTSATVIPLAAARLKARAK
jgi:hypothetical protein